MAVACPQQGQKGCSDGFGGTALAAGFAGAEVGLEQG